MQLQFLERNATSKDFDFKFFSKILLQHISLFVIISCHHNIINKYNENCDLILVMFDEYNIASIALFVSKSNNYLTKSIKPSTRRLLKAV